MSFIIQWLYLLALVVWVGGIIFFSFFTTPAVFTHLPKEVGSQFLSAIFPNYYLWGYVAGGVLLLTTLAETFLAKGVPWIRLILILVMLGCTIVGGQILLPKIHQLKVQIHAMEETSPAAKPLQTKFSNLHRFSVLLNLIVLLAGLFLVGIVAFRLRL